MLNWLSSRLKQHQTNHPLGNDKAIDRYLAEIPLADPKHTLGALDEWLEQPSRLFAELPPPLAVRALSRLDEFAQPALTACWQTYFADDRRDYLADLTLKRLETYYTHIEAAYRHALSLMPLAGNEARDADKNELALLSLRAMSALNARKKIGHFTYQNPDADWWKAAHELLFLARNLSILHTLQSAYHGTEPGTVWHEYMAGLVFEVAPLSTLSPAQVEALDCIARWAEPHFICMDTFSPQTPFRIRLDQTSGPERCLPGQEENQSCRYFGPAQAQGQLAQLRALVSTGKTPDWMPWFCTQKQTLDLLENLLKHWSMTPPKRLQNRHEQKGVLLITQGFTLARRMIAASEFVRSGRSLDYRGHDKYLHHLRAAGIDDTADPSTVLKTPLESLQRLETSGDRQMMERWEVIDISARGLGARLPLRRPWQIIGALVAYRHDGEIDWHIGIVRRLGRSHGKPNAGLGIFEGTPQCGQLHLLNQEDDGLWDQQTRDTSGHGLIDAILVSAATRHLLLPKGTFTFDRRADFLLGGKRIPMRLTGIEASGDDYDLVLYRALDIAAPQPAA